MNRIKLKTLIIKSLRQQGFRISNGQVSLPRNPTKDRLRALHRMAVQHRVARSEPGLVRYESRLLNRLAAGTDIDPSRITPRLVVVESESEDELLFRYASLHWSIPVSSGYGRRIRFLVIDDQNDKLIGLFGLADPVFNLSGRDSWIGWDWEHRRTNLHHVMDSFVLGAVPPYSMLLCGKLVAMLVASNEVRAAFRRKYSGCQSLISEKNLDGRLALVTTTSAFGRSSIYNRLRFSDRVLFQSAGFTQGSGEFQFSNGLYGAMSVYANRYCEATGKKEAWGEGFRNRREIVKKCLSKVGLSTEWIYHGIQREIFVVPLAKNAKSFLRGEQTKLYWLDRPSAALFEFFKERWLAPRSSWDFRYKNWHPEQWRLWEGPDGARGRHGSNSIERST